MNRRNDVSTRRGSGCADLRSDATHPRESDPVQKETLHPGWLKREIAEAARVMGRWEEDTGNG